MKLYLNAFILTILLMFAGFVGAVIWSAPAHAAISKSVLCPDPKLVGTRDTRVIGRAAMMCTDRKPCPVLIEKRGDSIKVKCEDKIKWENLKKSK